MRAALLARVSDARQGEPDRHSLPIQLSEMHALCERRGWSVSRVFEIPGESASREYLEERPQFAEAVRFCLSGGADVLVIFDPTRFARQEAVAHTVVRDLKRAGVGLFFVEGEWFAADNPVLLSALLMVAAQTSAQQARKIASAFARRHSLGLHTGNVPFGYEAVPGRPELPARVVPAEAEMVRWLFRQRARGAEYLELAAECARRGMLPRSQRGVGWTVSSLASLIENPFYFGQVTHLGHVAVGRHEPILSESEWQAAQRKRAARTQVAREDRSLLTGIAECARCRGPVWSRTSGGGGYYYDAAAKRGRPCESAGVGWLAAEADGVIERLVLEMSAPSGWFEEARSLAAKGGGEGEGRDEERARLQARRERLTTAYVEGALAVEDWRREKAKVERRLASLVEVEEEGSPARMARSMARLSSMREMWEVMTKLERGELVRLLFERVSIDTAQRRVVGVHPQGEVAELVGLRAQWVGLGCVAPRAGLERNPHPAGIYRWYDLQELVA